MDRLVDMELGETRLTDALNYLIFEERIGMSYRSDQIPDRVVEVHITRWPLRRVLDFLLEDTQLYYRQAGQQILILERPVEQRRTISGFVEDRESGERLIGANVFDRASGFGTASDEYGFFSLTLPRGPVNLTISYLGYKTDYRSLPSGKDKRLRIQLLPDLTEIPQVLVISGDSSHLRTAEPVSLPLQEMKRLPRLAGEADPLRLALLLPGITSGADGLEGIHIRGADAGQNLVLLDGVPVYNVNHAGGLFSIFNEQSLRSVDIYKSAIPANFGGRLAGVIDVRTKEGNLYELAGQADIGLLTSRLTLEGPLRVGTSSFLVSGRLSHVQHFIQELTRRDKAKRGEIGSTDYKFYDFNVKLNHQFSQSDRVYLSVYRGFDEYRDGSTRSDTLIVRNTTTNQLRPWRFDQQVGEHLQWGNTVAALRWNHLFSDKFFGNLTATYSRLATDGGYTESDSVQNLVTGESIIFQCLEGIFQSSIRDIGLRFDGHILPLPGRDWRFGAALTAHRFTPNAREFPPCVEDFEVRPTDLTSESQEFNFYLQYRRRYRRWWWQAGLHLSGWSINPTTYWNLQPRLALGVQLTKRLDWKASYDRTVQYIHRLSANSIGLPSDLWVPATLEAPPAVADQYSTGLTYDLGEEYALETEVYLRNMTHLVSFSEGTDGIEDYRDNLTSGRGEAAGWEVLLVKKRGRLTGWVSYTLARSDRQFDRVNRGRTFPFRYDRRHDFKIAFAYQARPWLLLSANYLRSSGSAFSFPLATYETPTTIDGLENDVITTFVLGDKNQLRFPTYHRLDLSATMQWQSDVFRHQLSVGLYNAYDRRNPIYYDLRTVLQLRDGQFQTSRELVQAWIAPLLPSLNYSITF